MRYNIKSILVLLMFIVGHETAQAVPAYNRSRCILQPDGSKITVIGQGDEFCHFLTTTDGYTVVKDKDGFYHYADLRNGTLVSSSVRAYDSDLRVSSEISYLKDKEKYLSPEISAIGKSLKASERTIGNISTQPARRVVSAKDKNFRGLVILAGFNDRDFSRGNESARNFYNKMFNLADFTRDTDRYYGTQTYTGSVKDYFSDNSNGQFAPEFDVIGPITVDVSQYYINCIANSYSLAAKVLTQADSQIDYSRYDSDNDGELDMVYIIYAGYSSHYSGNDERLIWPHAGSMTDNASTAPNLILDGKRMGRFACSAEIFGWQEDKDLMLDGIGVIVHEFSHTLGFMDHYDTSNGYQEHPNTWDIMAAGSYSEDYNRTPVAYNSYEKYVAGFIDPLNITDMDGSTVTLESNESSHDACLLRSFQDDVLFLMENRQNDKWDKYLPGHGLLVWRVDSTNLMYWQNNALNVTTRACFRLVRACGTQGSFLTGVEDKSYDPFPGTRMVTELDNDDDDANLLSYNKYPCPVVLRNIRESGGKITFDVERDNYAFNSPITYTIPSTLTVNAERLVDNNWIPVSWKATSRMKGDDYILSNLIPNDVGITSSTRDYSNGVYVSYTYNNDIAHTITISSQRVALNDSYGTWLCDINNVRNNGAGSMTLSVDRYGIPEFKDSTVMISYCKLQPKSYMVSQKNLIEELDVYRNVRFSMYTGSETSVIDTSVETSEGSKAIKTMLDGRIVILKDGKYYNMVGQQIEH